MTSFDKTGDVWQVWITIDPLLGCEKKLLLAEFYSNWHAMKYAEELTKTNIYKKVELIEIAASVKLY